MGDLDQKLVTRGKKETREGLRDEGVVHVGLGRKYETELAAAGWPAERTKDMEGLVEMLGSNVASQAEAKIEVKGKTVEERVCRALAKDLIGKVRLGASIVLAGTEVPGVAMESFEAGHTLGQSTPKVAMYLERILPSVAKLDEHLMPYFGGEKASDLVAQSKKDLDAAQSTQEVDLAALPRETLEVYEAKGRLLVEIETMNKIGKMAFWDQSEIVGQFNKDVLKRARKSRKKEDAAGAADAM